MFLVGDNYYGKVDHVRGEFFVATRFLHIWGVPIVPRDTILFLDQGEQGIPVIRMPFSWRSVIVGWMRRFLWFAIAIAFLSIGVPFEAKNFSWKGIAIWIGIVVVLETIFIATLWSTYRLTNCSPTRAEHLRRIIRPDNHDISSDISATNAAGEFKVQRHRE